jgi:hypothetical protein
VALGPALVRGAIQKLRKQLAADVAQVRPVELILGEIDSGQKRSAFSGL